jgi:CubicO group peptidase (beta-lactamase class C family)
VALATGAAAQYLPQQNNRPHLPEAWLLGPGQPWFYKASATGTPRQIGQRNPTPGEVVAITDIKETFKSLPSVAILMGDGDQIVDLIFKSPAGDISTFLSASMDKTVTAMSAGVAVCDGKIKMTTKVKELLPELGGKDIGDTTLRENLMMASGTKDAFADSQSLTREQSAAILAGKISFMDLLKGPLGDSQFFSKPGKHSYKTQDPTVVGMMISAAYGKGGRDFREWQDEHFFTKVQTADRRIHGRDHFGYAWTDGNTRMTIRDWARFASFVQESRKQAGCYGDFVREATSTQVRNGGQFVRMYRGYGYFTWTDSEEVPNSFSALGYGGQAIIWSNVNNKYLIVFSTNTIVPEILPMAKRWLESR